MLETINRWATWKERKPCRRKEEDQKLSEHIGRIFREHRGRYGSPRVWEELKSLGLAVSRKRVERLMREQKMRARGRYKRVVTTDSRHGYEAAGGCI